MIKKITEYDQEIPQPHTLMIIFVIYLISVYYIETWRVSITDTCTFHLNFKCWNAADR